MRPFPVSRYLLTGIIARNVLLLSLIVDGTKDDLSWNLYYHFRIDGASLQLLQSQAQKLLSLSISLKTWRESKYRELVRWCDYRSLEKVREIWSFYGIDRKGKDLSSFKDRFEARIAESNKHAAARNISVNLTGLRSSAPAQRHSIGDVDALHKHYWKHGSTVIDQPILSKIVHANPMFATPDDNVVLHYGTDPLLGFHLASAYVPLTPTSPLFQSLAGLSSQERVVMAAKSEFRSWATSFRKHSHSITLRVFVGDALAFSHSIQRRGAVGSPISAHWYCDRFHFDPLILDDEEYAEGCASPTTFSVIDTSNLIDHVGILNVLVAAAPLLADEVSATLYTEKLVRTDTKPSSFFNDLLCCPLPTMSTLFGLTPVDFMTKTSMLSSGDELLMDVAATRNDESLQSGQLFTRIAWKQPKGNSWTLRKAPSQICFDADELATVLYQTYMKIFENEDVMQLMSNLTLQKLQRFSVPTYHRATFVAFVGMLRTRLDIDWERTISSLLSHIETNLSHMLTMNYIQELYVWMHLLNVYSVRILKSPCSDDSLRTGDLRDWKNIPSVVCVTLKVPRERLKVITGRDVMEVGTPPLHCAVQGYSDGRPWQNIFGAVQMGFGTLERHGTPFSASFRVCIIEDRSGWNGASPLFVSFYAPTWTLLQQPRTASVCLGIQTTPQAIQSFLKKLGPQLAVYQTTLSDVEHVYISKNLPNQPSAMSICSFPVPVCNTAPDSQDKNASTTITASVDQSGVKVTSLAGRVDIVSDKCKAVLRAGGQIGTASESPFTFVITLQPGMTFTVNFPVAMLESTLKTRIARKSSYVELICQVAETDGVPSFRSVMYPVFADSKSVATWNVPYINLQPLPILDTKQKAHLDWLNGHISMMFNDRETLLRDNSSIQAQGWERTRSEFKDSLLSLFMHYTGIQGQQAQTFGIDCPTDGGVHILIFVSSLRLDLSNRTVVLDAAVLPLYDALVPRIAPFLSKLVNGRGLCTVKATEAEMRCWKQALPALVERCRTWSHKPSCQYLTERRVPLSVERGKRPLCSCGDGRLPADLIKNVTDWDKVAKYAVRAAISPCFLAAMFDIPYIIGKISGGKQESNVGKCKMCNRDKMVDGSGLLSCARCHRVKYCSRECQRADWKMHKNFCKAA